MTPYVSLPCPAGAAANGCTQNAAYVVPHLTNVNLGPYGSTALADLYSGTWAALPVPNSDNYSMQDGVLTLENPGDAAYAGSLCTVSTQSTPGNVPLLPMGKPWYAEALLKTSSAQVGNFPAFFSEPIQHNQAKGDLNPAVGEEWWLELDFYEGGAGTNRGEGPGMWGGMVAWFGTYPNYQKVTFKNPYSDLLFDPSHWHRYGFAWNPAGTGQGEWWIDDVMVGSVPLVSAELPPGFLAWITKHSNYLIFNNTGSPPYPAYSMGIREFSTWVPPG